MKRPYQKPVLTPMDMQNAWGGPPKRPPSGGDKGTCVSGWWAGDPNIGTCGIGALPRTSGACGPGVGDTSGDTCETGYTVA
jgi:hypothetical protein